LAEAAARAGHRVALVLGPAEMVPPPVDDLVRVTSAREMFDAVAVRFEACDVLVAAAAVADYRPASPAAEKIRKGEAPLTLTLEPTPDILAAMARRRRPGQVLVGFCLESEDLEARARAKREAKDLDLVVANPPAAVGADRQDALLIRRDGTVERLAQVTKGDVAARILAAAAELASA
ncbi:MAG: phosphopantothenoylcysteine decarboxylase, partial [Phycisphaerae bacterium]